METTIVIVTLIQTIATAVVLIMRHLDRKKMVNIHTDIKKHSDKFNDHIQSQNESPTSL